MKVLTLPLFALSLVFLAAPAWADDAAGDSEHGESLFQHHCSACHSMTTNRVGPVLSGVYGRKAGTADGFNYSSAVKAAGFVWNQSTLDQWLTNPQKLVPGQRMNFNISDPQKRADIIAYLKKASEQGGAGK